MRKQIYFTISLLAFLSLHMSLMAQNRIITSFQVLNSSDGKPVSFARMIDRTNNHQWITNEEGKSTIGLQDSTLVKITALGFHDYYWLSETQSDTVQIKLIPKIYELQEVAISPYPTIAIFKKAFENLETEDSSFLMENLWPIYALNPYTPNLDNYHNQDVVSIYLGSPITGLYNAFSKKAKSLRKFKLLSGEDKVNLQVSKRYNSDVVRKLTGVQDFEKIQKIMDYCKPSLEFIMSATEYELAMHIISCYQNFLLEEQ